MTATRYVQYLCSFNYYPDNLKEPKKYFIGNAEEDIAINGGLVST